MNGGSRRSGLLAVALVVCLSGMASACENEPTGPDMVHEPAAAAQDSEPARATAADYGTWQPSYRWVRPATATDVDDLSRRVADLAGAAYTVTVPTMDLQIARTAQHVRVTIGGAWTSGYELHLDPRDAGEELLDIGPFVLCSLADDSCTEVGEDRESGGAPHLFNNGLDTLVFTAGTIVQAGTVAADELRRIDPDSASVAVVDSPAGPLDCLVTGGRARQHARLEGRAVDLDAPPFSLGRQPPLTTTCVDEHGLVVLSVPSLLAPVVPYSSFEDGVPDGFNQHAVPTPYGTSPSPTAAESASPASDGMHFVVVAADLIEAGESLADAQAAGRFDLDAVLGAEMVEGAVSSTAGLTGRAVRDIAEGEQITADLFR
ncbi:hypothetical protein IEZ26_05305 [Nocardioides cavernae]|uniref:Uncharacterized protein n=1 Tax=Nocardioides cavernae TaxID=1921566 RepID=A0ABR8NAY7_9ACTN|nr:hypothetical protein [Nocardioides cavernae]MBD3924029.1 hypothetical protein [Nocardioides cavernae]MBM7511033.1 hypothetical protein [Nocardioides cavernae]